MSRGQQWTVDGQLGDQAIIEVGLGTVHIGGRNGNEVSAAAMLSPAGAREYADRLREAADECDRLMAERAAKKSNTPHSG